MSKLGNLIKTLRNENNMTQAELAGMLHITDKAVSKWERDLSYPDISIIPKLAEIFDVTVSDLLKAVNDDGDSTLITRMYQAPHDIRTPIHIIIGCTDLVEKYADDPELRQRYLEIIRLSGQFLLEKIEDLRKPEKTRAPYPSYDLSEYYRLHAGPSESNAYNFIGKRVLITDDIELNCEIAGEIIRQTGAETEFAHNGVECVDMVEKAPAGYYDLILMDISMPEMDGIKATQKIRANENEEKAMIPIVAMTANVGEQDRKAAMDAGMNAFTEKPIHTGKLYEVLDDLLNGSATQF